MNIYYFVCFVATPFIPQIQIYLKTILFKVCYQNHIGIKITNEVWKSNMGTSQMTN